MKILYLLFALFFLVVQSSAQGYDRDIPGLARCLARGGGCYLFRCPPRTVLFGRCTRYNPCCRPQVSSGFYKGNITV
uniref:Beta-defensin-like domain-containing protein n=1 Tax=Chrysemys picta bellii TaxID=8478 RepID=A0A8C3HSJ9_CHRPI